MFIEVTLPQSRVKMCVAIEHITQFLPIHSDLCPNGTRICFNGQKNHLDVLESYQHILSLIQVFEVTGGE